MISRLLLDIDNHKMELACRFYRNKLPKVDDVVLTKVIEIDDYSVHVELLEYNNIGI